MNQSNGIFILGAGGHGKVVIATLLEAGQAVAAVLDDNPATWGTRLLGIPVIGHSSQLAKTPDAPAVIAIGNNAVRRRLAEYFQGTRWITAIHPRAYVHSSVKLGAGTVVFAGAIIQPDSSVGNHVIINTGATVDHDCHVADFAHIAPGTHIAGGVKIGEDTLCGIGSSILPGISVGARCRIGAGAVVIRDVHENTTVVGVPAAQPGKHDA